MPGGDNRDRCFSVESLGSPAASVAPDFAEPSACAIAAQTDGGAKTGIDWHSDCAVRVAALVADMCTEPETHTIHNEETP